MIDWVVKKKIFRNSNHAIWFLTTLSFAGLMIVYYLWPAIKFLWLLPIFIFHISPIIKSLKILKKGGSSDIYSEDCIWFNAGMIVLYLLIGIMVYAGVF